MDGRELILSINKEFIQYSWLIETEGKTMVELKVNPLPRDE
jgi:hypothetical protein